MGREGKESFTLFYVEVDKKCFTLRQNSLMLTISCFGL